MGALRRVLIVEDDRRIRLLLAKADPTGNPGVPGAVVGAVTPRSPAAQAGIARGDVLTAVGATTVAGTSDVQLALSKHEFGDRVSVTWVQFGTNTRVTKAVTLAPCPAATCG
jgi:S1-C subfamily serine protease